MVYSFFIIWIQIIYDWLDVLKDLNGVKIFINIILGEFYEEVVVEKFSYEFLLEKVIYYVVLVLEWVVYLIFGIDFQCNCYEMYVWGWVLGEEVFFIDK